MCYGKLCCALVVCYQTFWMLLEEVIVDQIQAKKALKSSLAVHFQVQVQRRVASIVIFVSRVSTLRCRCCFCKVNCWSVVVMADRQSSADSCMAAIGRLLSVAACRAHRSGPHCPQNRAVDEQKWAPLVLLDWHLEDGQHWMATLQMQEVTAMS